MKGIIEWFALGGDALVVYVLVQTLRLRHRPETRLLLPAILLLGVLVLAASTVGVFFAAAQPNIPLNLMLRPAG